MTSSDLNTAFSGPEWLRYTRHIQLPHVGAEGQQRLKSARVLIVGAGGLGSPVALYLAAAGVGEITLVDGDCVDVTNLQRQILFDTGQVGLNKADCAKSRLLALNPEIDVTAIAQHLTADNVEALVSASSLVLDCTDNFATRYLINDACIKYRKFWVFAAIHQFSGQCTLFAPDQGCFRCLFPEMPQGLDDCNSAGVLGVLPGIMGTLQANEALKFLVGQPTTQGTLLMMDAIDLRLQKIRFHQDKLCPACGVRCDDQSMGDRDATDRDSVLQTATASCSPAIERVSSLPAEQFEALRQQPEYLVVDVRTEAERNAFHIGGQHIPLAELAGSLDKLDRDKTILCYCQSGQRSARATDLLEEQGVSCKGLQGGLVGWLKRFG